MIEAHAENPPRTLMEANAIPGAPTAAADISAAKIVLPGFAMPEKAEKGGLGGVTLPTSPSPTPYWIKQLGQHGSAQAVYDEWTTGLLGQVGLKTALDTHGAFYMKFPAVASSWCRAVSERRLLCGAMEEKGVAAIQEMYDLAVTMERQGKLGGQDKKWKPVRA